MFAPGPNSGFARALPWQHLVRLPRDTFFRCLLAVDAAFVVLHIGRAVDRYQKWTLATLDHDLLALDIEGSLPEIYQHLKVAATAALLALIFGETRARIYAALSIVFVYVVLDDALVLHERAGTWVAARTDAEPPFGLDTAAVAELLFLVCVGVACLGLVIAATATSDTRHVRTAGLFLVPVAAFAFFGGAFDLLHAVVADAFVGANLLFSTIEDGGELFAMTIACALAKTIYRTVRVPVAEQ